MLRDVCDSGRIANVALAAAPILVGCAPLSDRRARDAPDLQSRLARFRRQTIAQRARDRRRAGDAGGVLALLRAAAPRPALAADYRAVAEPAAARRRPLAACARRHAPHPVEIRAADRR